MKKIERREHLKVLLGYLLLLALVVAAFYGVWKQLEELERPNSEGLLLNDRRRATLSFVLAMHEAETSAVGVGMGSKDDFLRYSTLVDTTLARLDTLRRRMVDTSQRARLDTLRQLLVAKRRSVARLISLMGRDDLIDFYEQQMKRISVRRDTVPVQRVEHRVVVRTDTVVEPPEKKNFFQRLAEAFVPSKRDSVKVKQEVLDERVDTLTTQVATTDTVAGIIGDVQDQARRYRMEQVRSLQQAVARVGRESWDISHRANQLLEDFDAEEQRLAAARLMAARTLRRQAAFTLAGTAGCALMLAGFFLFLIGRDLRNARRYREALEEANTRTEHLLRMRERLMLAVTHDLKAPAAAVLGYADLLLRRVSDRRTLSYVENIRQAANHLLALVRSLLDYHKLDANCVEAEHVPFDVGALFEAIGSAFRPMAEAKGLKLNCETDFRIRQAVGDPLRLRQMTENLLSNAVKFTTQGQVTLRVAAAEGWLTITVADTGRGIPASEQDRLFGEFARMSNAKGEEGFGLGLAITRKNAQLLGGDITVESTEGVGSTFTVRVPLEEGHVPPLSAAENKRLRVALLDDDVLQLQLCATMLRGEGHDVTCFDTPERLISNLHDSRYDVLLTDIQMPGLNGFELVRHLREDPSPRLRGLRVVAVTARDDISQEAFREAGFDACLRKPFGRSSLRACLQEPGTEGGEVPPASSSDSPAGDVWSPVLLFAAGDPEAEADILRTFAADTRASAAALTEAAEQRDTRKLSHIAHKLLPRYRDLRVQPLVEVFAAWAGQRDGFAWEGGILEKVEKITKEMQKWAAEAEKKANFALSKKKE